jgi:hypothetical protein
MISIFLFFVHVFIGREGFELCGDAMIGSFVDCNEIAKQMKDREKGGAESFRN